MFNEIIMPLAVGLAVFLFGMKVMELALHRWAGPYLKTVLNTFTETPFRGLLSGTGITALLQSSSAVTVMTIGFVNAGMLTFPRTLGIILGTNIGTCLTVELISLNITQYALPALVSSFCVWMMSWLIPIELATRRLNIQQSLRYGAMAVAGFSCVLLGMELMHAIAPALEARGMMTWFIEKSQQSLLWGVLAGMILTAIIQSSTATIAITMGLATAQLVSIDLGIAVILGANIGTCGTAFLANIGGTRSGQLVAWSHIILNIGGALLFLPLVGLLHQLVAMMSSSPAVQLAHSQTMFNIFCSIIALPICYMSFVKKIRIT